MPPSGGTGATQHFLRSEVEQAHEADGGRYPGELKVFSEENRKAGAVQERQREASKATAVRRS